MNNLPSSDSVTPSSSPAKPKFGLRWWILLPLVPLLGESIYSEYDGTSNGFSRSAGHFVGGILIGLLFAWLGWLFSRRSRFVASLTFVILVLLGVAGGVLGHQRELQKEATQNQALTEIENMKRDRAQMVQRFGAGEDVRDRLLNQTDAQVAQMESSAKNLDGDNAKILSANAALSKEINANARKFKQSLDELLPRLSTANFKNPGDIDQVITMLDECTHQVDAVDAFYQGTPQQLLKMMMDTGVAPRRAEVESRAYAQVAHISLHHDIREIDRVILRNMRQSLMILKDHWGQWQYDPEHGNTIFTNTQVLQQFNAAIAQVQSASQRQMQLQRQFAAEVAHDTPASPAP